MQLINIYFVFETNLT